MIFEGGFRAAERNIFFCLSVLPLLTLKKSSLENPGKLSGKNPENPAKHSTYDTNIPKVKEGEKSTEKNGEKRNKNKKSFFLSQIFLGFLIFFL